MPAISFQQKIAPINDTIFEVTKGSGILGRTIHFNTVLNGVPSDTQFWMFSQDEDLYLKLMNTRSQTDRFNAEMVVTDIDHDSEFDIVFSFTGENNGKQTNIETNLSLKIIDSSIPSYIFDYYDYYEFQLFQLLSKPPQFVFGITSKLSIDGQKYTYEGKFNSSVHRYDYSEVFKLFEITYDDRFCEGHSKCHNQLQQQFVFKIEEEANRRYIVVRFISLEAIISTKANPYDSIAPLVKKLYMNLTDTDDCDLPGLLFAEHPTNFIRQNMDNGHVHLHDFA